MSRIRWCVCPVQNKLSSFENAPHNFTLHADALAVDDADDREAFRMGFAQIFFDDGFDLLGRDRVQVNHVGDLQLHRRGKRVCRVVLNWEAAYGKAYQIQTSPDGAAWTTIYTTAAGDGGIDDLTGLAGTGRYVRMYGTARATAYGYSLWEFEIYGTFGGSTPTATATTARATATATAT